MTAAQPQPLFVLFVVHCYDDLLKGLIARRKSLGLTQLHLDQIAGWADGLTGKYESGKRIKGLGPLGLLTALQALDLELVAVPRGRPITRMKGAAGC
ncbi:MAG: helix-turn-helix domain-containing protein [Hyphomicrobiales bacterium]